MSLSVFEKEKLKKNKIKLYYVEFADEKSLLLDATKYDEILVKIDIKSSFYKVACFNHASSIILVLYYVSFYY